MYLAQILNIPSRLIIEVILCCIVINIIYSSIYFYLYKNNDIHFKNFFTDDKEKKITFGDFFYFSNNLFFSMSSGVIPQSNLSRIIVLSHIAIGFIFSVIFIGRIINIHKTGRN